MDKVQKLVHYISKYGKCTKPFAAKFLLNVFEKYEFFVLPDNKQKLIIENLISYFDNIIISFDSTGVTPNKQNKHISEKEIFKHIEDKTLNLVINSKYLKLI